MGSAKSSWNSWSAGTEISLREEKLCKAQYEGK